MAGKVAATRPRSSIAATDPPSSGIGGWPLSKTPRDRGAFKTPTLREIARTAPYMHDGSLATLGDVIDFYSEGGRPNPFLDAELRPSRFSPEEKRALVAFLQSLTGRVSEAL